MRAILIACVITLLPSFAAAQSEAVQSKPVEVKLVCRSLIAGQNNFLAPDETVVNGMACRTETAKPAPVAVAITAAPVPTNVVAVAAAPAPVIEPNSVFISPMDGFEVYLAAAFQKKHVPLEVVGDEDHAAYVIKGTADEKKAGWAKIVLGDVHSDNAASIQMIDQKSGAVIFAYAVNKKDTWHGQQTTAEACAKHLKDQLDKSHSK
ncbi:MAG: hypothetical protein WA876_07130 [Candidatus Acidiferrales bacterium]